MELFSKVLYHRLGIWRFKGGDLMFTVTSKAESMLKEMLANSDLQSPMIRLFIGGFG